MTFVTQEAKKLGSYDEGSLLLNMQAASRDAMGKGIIAYTADFFKGDMLDFLRAYNNRRPEDRSRVNAYVKDRNTGLWVKDYPNVEIDWTGTIIDGYHTLTGAYRADALTSEIGVILGIDPRMRTRTNTGKSRSVRQQAYYVDGLLTQITDKRDEANCMAAARHIWLYIQRNTHFCNTYNPTESAQRICQTEEGQAFLRKLVPYFVQLLEILNKSGVSYLKNVKFYVPALMLCLTEQEKLVTWACALAKGATRDAAIQEWMKLMAEICSSYKGYRWTDSSVREDVEKMLYLFYWRATNSVGPIAKPLANRQAAVKFFVEKIVSQIE